MYFYTQHLCLQGDYYLRARRALCGRRHMYAGPAELGGTVGTCPRHFSKSADGPGFLKGGAT